MFFDADPNSSSNFEKPLQLLGLQLLGLRLAIQKKCQEKICYMLFQIQNKWQPRFM